jgi:hypothetical protein
MVTLDGGRTWQDQSAGLMGARVQAIVASRSRTFVLWARTDQGLRVTRDGGYSWRVAEADQVEDGVDFNPTDFAQWQSAADGVSVRIAEGGLLVRRGQDGQEQPVMDGWRIPLARSLFVTPWGLLASGPGGCYLARDGQAWRELPVWGDSETGAADFLHAYWMGRYYGFIAAEE